MGLGGLGGCQRFSQGSLEGMVVRGWGGQEGPEGEPRGARGGLRGL